MSARKAKCKCPRFGGCSNLTKRASGLCQPCRACQAHLDLQAQPAPPDLAERIYWRLVNDGELRRTGVGPKALVLAAIREEIERGR